MNDISPVIINDKWVLAQRSAKNHVNPQRPYDFFLDKERTPNGQVEDVATIFLTNKECPYRCLMCDLWKNTTDQRVSDGSIPMQIQWAMDHLSIVQHIKLYNSGNFFDGQAIPPADIPKIAELLKTQKTVTIENHPKLVDERCVAFNDLLHPNLHVAMGLETVHPTILEQLNKRMTLKDFDHATTYLVKNDISVRAFILLRPPFLTEIEGVKWAKKSINYAFNAGVECCVIIPTRGGNGALEQLQKTQQFFPPKIESLEEVLEFGIQLNHGRVFADLWDINTFSQCEKCREKRNERMGQMNITQEYSPPVNCDCGIS
jgi:radical SAM enzyme (TIGR01210 family)